MELENKTTENQEVSSALSASTTIPTREAANPFLREAGLPYRRKAVEAVMGINPKTWGDLEVKGVIPLEGTYIECVQAIFSYYRKNNEAKLLKQEAAKETGRRTFETASGLSPLQEAEIIKKIKLNMAREEQIHILNAKERGTLLDKQELLELLGPILGNIASVLRYAADTNPDLQAPIDKCFESLFKAGQVLSQHCDVDSERYVKERMKEEVNLEEILAQAELEIY